MFIQKCMNYSKITALEYIEDVSSLKRQSVLFDAHIPLSSIQVDKSTNCCIKSPGSPTNIEINPENFP